VGSIVQMTWAQTMPADRDEKPFFKELGASIATLRKA